jgi:hypothetical protein
MDIEAAGGTKEDAGDYAVFLDKFGAALHSVGAKLSVDVGEYHVLYVMLHTVPVHRLIMSCVCSQQ